MNTKPTLADLFYVWLPSNAPVRTLGALVDEINERRIKDSTVFTKPRKHDSECWEYHPNCALAALTALIREGEKQ